MRIEREVSENSWFLWGVLTVVAALLLLVLPFGWEKLSSWAESGSESKLNQIEESETPSGRVEQKEESRGVSSL